MLKENSKIKVYICQQFPNIETAIKTDNSEKSKPEKLVLNGQENLNRWNTSQAV